MHDIITWCQECKLGVKILLVKKVEKKVRQIVKMAEQIMASEAIAKAVVKATRIVIQTMAEMQVQRLESQ